MRCTPPPRNVLRSPRLSSTVVIVAVETVASFLLLSSRIGTMLSPGDIRAADEAARGHDRRPKCPRKFNLSKLVTLSDMN